MDYKTFFSIEYEYELSESFRLLSSKKALWDAVINGDLPEIGRIVYSHIESSKAQAEEDGYDEMECCANEPADDVIRQSREADAKQYGR